MQKYAHSSKITYWTSTIESEPLSCRKCDHALIIPSFALKELTALFCIPEKFQPHIMTADSNALTDAIATASAPLQMCTQPVQVRPIIILHVFENTNDGMPNFKEFGIS